jgi:hypothetical protein
MRESPNLRAGGPGIVEADEMGGRGRGEPNFELMPVKTSIDLSERGDLPA